MRLVVSLLVIFLVGCGPAGEAPPKLYPVSGILTVEGTPLANVSVQLVPTEPSRTARPSAGVTDKAGRFQLQCNNEPGAAKGKYKLVLTKIDTGMGNPSMSNADLMKLHNENAKQTVSASEGTTEIKPLFPEKYSSPETSPGEVEILDHEMNLPLNLVFDSE